ncbi:aromatic ring-hydroxylating oxygenase subunit alpha [Novosphingobium album (ex Liu et al. 2023)]|uniref:Aromatic ring-hydroxylating dioxygenase subunit alpha n=1 Tax=Novosphingobium album (ex Liu et al. 2023) TaxID=3031130 RepID=A0ABT5WML3_9SPHN|nr:aromatic ring-hydroxylating dioxygenase subunit alpha [Novosphingobium album (ex Liu et al. 2023)]MDE8651289.1 aromatic ring-hydroxylating dioxygenase subunit alpha [Novosphingobium album (ex Liu et al. 2023)]
MADFDFAEAVRAGNPLAIADPRQIPSRRYYDEGFYQLECEQLWPHVWQMACRLEQIPDVGDWVEYTNVGKSVLVVRTNDGVKAYHNHCRHRGVPVAGGSGNAFGNCAKSGFVCPFHGWQWNMDGENTFVYGRQLFDEDQLTHAELALKPVRVETWGGCAFINLDDEAPSLRESLGPVLDRLDAHGMSKLRAEWWFGTVLPANWKIAMEAFMEGYHVMMTHPQLQRSVPGLYNARYGNDTGGIGLPIDPDQSVRDNIRAQIENLELLSSGMAGMCHAKEVAIARELADVDLPDNVAEAVPLWFGIVQEAISRKLRERGEDVPDLNAVCQSDPVNAVEFLFPHYFLLPFFTSMASYRIRPLGPESCMFEIWSLTHFAPGDDREPPMEPTVLPYNSQDFPMIPRQDYSNIPIQQKGLHSEGFDYMRLSGQVEGLISNYQRLIDGYIAGRDKADLARANQKLGGNFDGPVVDLWD